jgi:hypothetical protein
LRGRLRDKSANTEVTKENRANDSQPKPLLDEKGGNRGETKTGYASVSGIGRRSSQTRRETHGSPID